MLNFFCVPQELIAQRAGTKYDFGHGILGLVMITKNEANRCCLCFES